MFSFDRFFFHFTIREICSPLCSVWNNFISSIYISRDIINRQFYSHLILKKKWTWTLHTCITQIAMCKNWHFIDFLRQPLDLCLCLYDLFTHMFFSTYLYKVKVWVVGNVYFVVRLIFKKNFGQWNIEGHFQSDKDVPNHTLMIYYFIT